MRGSSLIPLIVTPICRGRGYSLVPFLSFGPRQQFSRHRDNDHGRAAVSKAWRNRNSNRTTRYRRTVTGAATTRIVEASCLSVSFAPP
jgi:hypothetical protein